MTDIKNTVIWVLLAAIAALGAFAWFSHERAGIAAGQRDLAAGKLRIAGEAIDKQKREARAALDAANASVLAQQKRLDAAYLSQEKTDGVNTQTVSGLRADLARLRTAAFRLLDGADGAGRRAGDADAGGQAAADSERGLSDRAQAAGLVPVPADQEAVEDDEAFDSDRINTAYASCRADALSVRQLTAPP